MVGWMNPQDGDGTDGRDVPGSGSGGAPGTPPPTAPPAYPPVLRPGADAGTAQDAPAAEDPPTVVADAVLPTGLAPVLATSEEPPRAEVVPPEAVEPSPEEPGAGRRSFAIAGIAILALVALAALLFGLAGDDDPDRADGAAEVADDEDPDGPTTSSGEPAAPGATDPGSTPADPDAGPNDPDAPASDEPVNPPVVLDPSAEAGVRENPVATGATGEIGGWTLTVLDADQHGDGVSATLRIERSGDGSGSLAALSVRLTDQQNVDHALGGVGCGAGDGDTSLAERADVAEGSSVEVRLCWTAPGAQLSGSALNVESTDVADSRFLALT